MTGIMFGTGSSYHEGQDGRLYKDYRVLKTENPGRGLQKDSGLWRDFYYCFILTNLLICGYIIL